MTTNPTLNPDAIQALRDLSPEGDGEFLRELIAIYLADTPRQLGQLTEALARQDAGQVLRAAHSIKGSSANLGALALRAAAEKLEHHSRTKGLGGVATMIAEVRNEFARAQTELAKIIAR